MKSSDKKVVIIGAGLAGFSLATELVDEGFNVEIIEAKQYLGGRASNTVDRAVHDAVPIGPHVFVGWYNNFFRFLRKIKAHRLIEWEQRVCLEIFYEGRHHKLKFYKLPPPLFTLPWILTYPFMGLRDKLSNRRMFANIYFFSTKKWLDSLDKITAYDFLRQQGVTERCIDAFWRMIAWSLLNLPLETCSAAEFAILVKHWAHLKHRKFGFAKVGLGDVYADEAYRYICERGASVHRATKVLSIETTGSRVSHIVVEHAGVRRRVNGDIFISTVDPVSLRSIFPARGVQLSELRNHLDAFRPVPYISVNLWFDEKITHKQFWAIFGDDPQGSPYLNTDFYDLSNIYEHHADRSYIASNIIYSERWEHLSDKEITERTLKEIRDTFPHVQASPTHEHVHRIPYVIYAPIPGMRKHKVSSRTALVNFYVAGDWTIAQIPQCMEAAVRSGYKCAESVLEDHGINKKICNDVVA